MPASGPVRVQPGEAGSDRRQGAGRRFSAVPYLVVVDGAGLVQWLAIGLSFVAVIVILRYARQPRCDACSRRHARRDRDASSRDVGLIEVELPEVADWATISWKAE